MMKLIMIKFINILGLVILGLFVFVSTTEAKVLPRYKTAGKAVSKSYAAPVGISVSARFRGDRQALNVYFNNLKNATDVSYTLTYETNGKAEGAGGSVDVSAGNATRELLFGTCSSGVCRYHTGITGMKLEVVSQLLSGKKSVKRFRIKV
ncbi:MAG: hypothetical protein HYW86_04320 [Candidatus Roizmanbacteria bacterium]|nr:MAG: hypothetical protein HYW86_04320 [Candidatus Roizmanbacteria bacterium]